MSIVDKLLEAEGDIVLGFRRPDLSDLLREAASEYETLAAVNAELLEALEWMVETDETNEGGKWDEINAYWIAGLNRARAAIAKAKGDDHA